MFFSFGAANGLRLLVAVSTLRQVYDGPVTVFLLQDEAGPALEVPLKQLKCDVVFMDQMSRSWDRHRIFYESPYRTTLMLDSDMIFRAPIEDLWEPLEQAGLLVTRYFFPPYGVDGTPSRPGWINRVSLLDAIRDFDLVDAETHKEARRRMCDEHIDVNVGVMGIARPRGDVFLDDFAERMERGRSTRIGILDEMLTVALLPKHRHFLADEKWNCPADEFFRRTNLADAKVIHYFADGTRVKGMRLGRNPATWAGKKWYEAYHRTNELLDLRPWRRADPTFSGRWRRMTADGAEQAALLLYQRVKQMLKRI